MNGQQFPTVQTVKIYSKNNTIGGVDFYIYLEDFDDYNYYIDAINTILTVFENDNIYLNINSFGGRVDIMDSFLNAIDSSNANSIVANIIGNACSAAAIIALACDDIITNYNSTMLIHSISMYQEGKLAHITDHLEIYKIKQKRIAERYYKYFLTDDEIDDVLIGKELWLTSDEINERWEIKQEQENKEKEEYNKEIKNIELNNIISYLQENGYKVELDKNEKT